MQRSRFTVRRSRFTVRRSRLAVSRSRLIRRQQQHQARSSRRWIIVAAAALSFSGCELLNSSTSSLTGVSRNVDKLLPHKTGSTDSRAKQDVTVANPPAKTIRFDGREVVLGTADIAGVDPEEFCTRLSDLLTQEKHYSAGELISRHSDVAQQVLWQRWTNTTDAEFVRFTANVLSKGAALDGSWNGLLAASKQRPLAAEAYHQARDQFVQKLKAEDPSGDEAEKLRAAAEQLKHPLAMMDALNLLAVRELVAGRGVWAEALFLQAADLAEQHHDAARAADLWLMLSTTATRSEKMPAAKEAWNKAVQKRMQHCAASDAPLNARFWIRAEQQRPPSLAWPDEITQTLLDDARSVGCSLTSQSPAELVLWTAIGSGQYDQGEPQLALVYFKKAEGFASGDNIMWLRIAQSKCLAALGQDHAAALLAGPAASQNPTIAAASAAAMGSAKLQAGTYQQGAQLLNKALNDSLNLDWPSRSNAEADLALAQLIIGETDKGLAALHATQANFQLEGDLTSLLQSLENELSILKLEGRTDDARKVEQRIREIEHS